MDHQNKTHDQSTIPVIDDINAESFLKKELNTPEFKEPLHKTVDAKSDIEEASTMQQEEAIKDEHNAEVVETQRDETAEEEPEKTESDSAEADPTQAHATDELPTLTECMDDLLSTMIYETAAYLDMISNTEPYRPFGRVYKVAREAKQRKLVYEGNPTTNWQRVMNIQMRITGKEVIALVIACSIMAMTHDLSFFQYVVGLLIADAFKSFALGINKRRSRFSKLKV
ncbi:hypothetical protein BJ508DRAFT_303619 [Ascobolus immersus RN42]|uniref:Uncharacterized protein n=1 Tax=Ascobolus immersus RN42 TaxID=1160509 RepID=A0A3N4IFD2_ASCIM|nr:hypothetical protein BJ508DRAFT_303619 [Ascobolus immersus RN42]